MIETAFVVITIFVVIVSGVILNLDRRIKKLEGR